MNMKTAILLLSFASLSLAIPREDFYSFGPDAGDTAVDPNDDGSSPQISLQFGSFPYFDEQHTTLYVNNNGDISFAGPVRSFTPSSFPLQGFSLIAPYWGDVDTRGTGTVYYRETRSSDIMRRARDDITRAFSIRFQPIFAFIATWDRVGHYNRNTERIATFQCVLMTDGTVSYVKFLYADGEIQWTTGDASGGTDGFGGTPAQVGFDAGDGERFFSVPGSQTNDIANIASTTNVNVPGVWTFQVNGDIATCSSVEDMENTPLVITPRVGSMLGGTAVAISSICLDISDTITCQYEGFNAITADIQEPDTENEAPVALCVSPAFPQPGSKQLRILVVSQSGETKYDTSTRFYARSIEDSDEVRLSLQSPLVNPQSRITLSWEPLSLIPAHVLDPSSYRVNIVLVRFDMHTGEWQEVPDGILNPSHENTGQAEVVIDILIDNNEIISDVQPIAIQVKIESSAGRKKRAIRAIDSVIQWTKMIYYSFSNSLRRQCYDWCESQPPNIGDIILDELARFAPCAPRVDQARLPNSGLVEDTGVNRLSSNYLFHRGTDTCFRSETPSPSGYGQQCCYTNGFLVVGNPGGSVDKVAPSDLFGHFREDVIPSVFCCHGEFSDCSLYYSKRPSDDGERFNPPNPACVYGDPHIVSLDGFKYTFNGRGEYLLAQVDEVFTFQGRMIQPSITQGSTVNATVFSAIAVREGDNTVQFQVGAFAGDPDVLINGAFIDFIDITAQDFNGVVVTKMSNTLSVRFDSGAFIEAREENGFFSTLLVSLPTSWQGQTRGLMGNYNGNTSDDLTPQTGEPLPLDSDLRTIHDSFGVTWIISDQQDSIFSYSEGDSFSDYYFPSFVPTFEVTFSDASLEQSAIDICGDDLFCRFDIATTGSTTIGLSTLMGGQEFDQIVNNSQPTVCNPPCVNGACVATDNCSCSMGYTGPQCDIPILTECDVNVCQNGGSCSNVAGSFICSCPSEYGGSSCEIEVLDFFSGSGSGSGSGMFPTDCVCSRSVECSVEGKYSDTLMAEVTGTQLKCIIMFPSDVPGSGSDIGSGIGSGSSFVIADTFTAGNLSSGSLLFLVNLGVLTSSFPEPDSLSSLGGLTRDEGFVNCSVPSGLPVRSVSESDTVLQNLDVTFVREDRSFGRQSLMLDNLGRIINPDVDLGSEENRCSLLSLQQWLSSQPSPLPSTVCREEAAGANTDIFFTIECSN